MKTIGQIVALALFSVAITGCHVTTHSDGYILELDFSYYHESGSHNENDWAVATESLFRHYDLYYSYTDLLDYQYVYLDSSTPTIDDISWMLWDLGWIDSYVTGTLSRNEIASRLRAGHPVLLQYGRYSEAHYLVVYGYDGYDHVYVHEPGYGTHRIHYDDLYYRYIHGTGHYWESTLVVEG